jgi:methylated-DNA-[protein]-cysteine S-methyltransferase
MDYVSFFNTGQGRGAVVATEKGICRVCLPGDDAGSRFTQDTFDIVPPSTLTEQVSRMLTKYFKGEPQIFELVALDYKVSGDFRRRILEQIRSIPFGRIQSYGEVATAAGAPRAARAVGGAMASNPLPIIIPCHRVIAADGRLTGYSAPGGLLLKKFILQMEGVEFKGELVIQNKVGY